MEHENWYTVYPSAIKQFKHGWLMEMKAYSWENHLHIGWFSIPHVWSSPVYSSMIVTFKSYMICINIYIYIESVITVICTQNTSIHMFWTYIRTFLCVLYPIFFRLTSILLQIEALVLPFYLVSQRQTYTVYTVVTVSTSTMNNGTSPSFYHFPCYILAHIRLIYQIYSQCIPII